MSSEKMAWLKCIFFVTYVMQCYADNPKEKTASFWIERGEDELKRAVAQEQLNINIAKNVIIFLGDGMSIPTVAAARVLKAQKSGKKVGELSLTMESLSHVALSKTYAVNRQVSDSACTATAFLCGVKTNDGSMGVNAASRREDCKSDDPKKNDVNSVLVDGWKSGKSSGIVSTTRITHATPGTAYAHVVDRLWHSDADFTEEDRQHGCTDIAQQFYDSSHMFEVVLAGGRRNFYPNGTVDCEYGDEENRRLDGQNLIEKWLLKNSKNGKRAKYVWNQTEFNSINPKDTDYLLGLFQPKDMQFEAQRQAKDKAGEPSLAEMTEKAISMLQKNPKGFVLLVEGGRIAAYFSTILNVDSRPVVEDGIVITHKNNSVYRMTLATERSGSAEERKQIEISLINYNHAHHDGNAYLALHDTLAFDDAITKGIEMTSEEDTLIIVTADHGHTMTVGGYSERGNPIFGLAPSNENPNLADDGKTYTTIMYANGPGQNASLSDDGCSRKNLSSQHTSKPDYLQQAAIPLEMETHGGEDVAIFSSGPMAHLFHGVHEQSYIASVVRYASCIGPKSDNCRQLRDKETELPDTIVQTKFLGLKLSPSQAQIGLHVMFVLLIGLVLLILIFMFMKSMKENSKKRKAFSEESGKMLSEKL